MMICRRHLLAAIAIAFASACHGTVGPVQPSLPLDSIELTGVPAAGTVGDRFPLKVVATNLHGASEDVTTRVTWSSTNAATAAVSAAGELTLVGVGACEIRASIDGVSTSTAVAVAARPPGRSTLAGSVTDSATGKVLANATVEVLDGPNVGRSASTDESGFYSLPALIQGSFAVRVTRGGYETTEGSAALSGDARLDFRMRALPPPPFTGATYNVRVTVASNQCGISLPSSGRLVLSGTARRLTIRLEQGINEREYFGSLEGDGTFTGSTGGLAAAHGNIPESSAHGVSTIKGRVIDSNISGTEKLASHLCPGGLGIVNVGFSGSN